MFGYCPDINQQSITETYNRLVDILNPMGFPLKKLSSKGSCNGFTYCFVIYSREGRQEEFFACFQFLQSLKQESNLTKFVEQIKNNKNVSFKLSEHSSPTPFQKVLDLLEKVSLAQDEQSFKQIPANWDKTFTFICHKNKLDQFLKIASIGDTDKIFFRLFNHTFFIEKDSGKFCLFESNNFKNSKSNTFQNESDLSKQIIKNISSLIGEDNLILFSMLFISYGDSNRELDDIIMEFKNEATIFPSIHSLIKQYDLGKVSRLNLAYSLADEIKAILNDNKILLSNKFHDFNTAINNYLKDKINYCDLTTRNCSNDLLKMAFNGNSLLFHAISFNQFELLKELVIHGAEINQPNKDGHFPLHIATEMRNVKMIKFLITYGANINQIDQEGVSPLYLAVVHGSVEIVKLLITYGANVNQTAENGWSLLNVAVSKNSLEIGKLLITHGASINQTNKLYSPLYLAAKHGFFDIVKLLVIHGAEVNQPTQNNGFPIEIAVKNGHLNIVEYLLLHGANVDQRNSDNFPLISIAARHGNLEITMLLISHGAKINQIMRDEFSPLYLAVRNKHLEVTNLLVSYGANVNQTDNAGQSPLFIGVRNKDESIVKILLKQKNIQVNHKIDEDPSTLLTLLSMRNIENFIKQNAFIHEHIKNLSEKISGITPLHIAVLSGSTNIVKLLLEAGANTDLPILGANLLKFSEGLGYDEIVTLLKENKASESSYQNSSQFQIKNH